MILWLVNCSICRWPKWACKCYLLPGMAIQLARPWNSLLGIMTLLPHFSWAARLKSQFFCGTFYHILITSSNLFFWVGWSGIIRNFQKYFEAKQDNNHIDRPNCSLIRQERRGSVAVGKPKKKQRSHSSWNIPSWELTYPTLGKGTSSSKCHFWGDMLVPWRVSNQPMDPIIRSASPPSYPSTDRNRSPQRRPVVGRAPGLDIQVDRSRSDPFLGPYCLLNGGLCREEKNRPDISGCWFLLNECRSR